MAVLTNPEDGNDTYSTQYYDEIVNGNGGSSCWGAEHMKWLSAAAVFCALLSGCAYTPLILGVASTGTKVNALRAYADAKKDLGEFSSLRIFVYRPQFFRGMAAAPIVVVNEKWMGSEADRLDNLFLPGTVFVVDISGDLAHVRFFDQGKYDERTLSLSAAASRVWYLRWKPEWTKSFLEVVSADEAQSEIEPLQLSGHVRLNER
jgi:hypothetical protein